MRVSHVPLRASTGAFILNEGLSKRAVDPRAADGLPSAFPQLATMSPGTVSKGVVATEVALGGLLLAPFVPPLVAGTALAAFGAGMLQSRRRSVERGDEPEKQKTLAKDLWMLGTGLALVLDSVTDGARRTSRRTSKAAKRTAEAVKDALPVG